MSRTGLDNAMDFVTEVKKRTKVGLYVLLDEENWPWMANEDWREKVLTELAMPETFFSVEFKPPRDFYGWTFIAILHTAADSYENRKLSDPE